MVYQCKLNQAQEQDVPDGLRDSGLGDVSIGVLDPMDQISHGCREGSHIDPPLELSPQEEVTCSNRLRSLANILIHLFPSIT